MAIKEVRREWDECQLDYVKEFILHTEADVADLPECCVGSTAIVGETGNVYVSGKGKAWKKREEAMVEGPGTPSGGGDVTGAKIEHVSGVVMEENELVYTENGFLSFEPLVAVPVEGASCVVEIKDGTTNLSFKAPCFIVRDEVDMTVIGNPSVSGEGEDNGVPFMLAIVPDEMKEMVGGATAMLLLVGNFESTTVTLKVFAEWDIVHKIDEKFLPNFPSVFNIVDGSATGSLRTVNASAEEIYTIGDNAFAQGNDTKAQGIDSHAEGRFTTASGEASHSEGVATTASGWGSHAEGDATRAAGNKSHAEGVNTETRGNASHAEGSGTLARASSSHAEGDNTIAASNNQHVQGKYNIEDASEKYAHIVGNGKNGAPSNAHTLDWKGNAWFAGTVEGTAVILASPNGTRYKVTVADDGTLSASAITE